MRKFVVAAAIAAASLSSTATFAQAPQPKTARPAAAKPSAAKPSAAKPSAAQPVALPAARTIIDRHIKAIGGRTAILAYTSTRATGTLSVPGPGMSGTFEMLAAKPNKMMLRISLSGIGEIIDGFDGTNGWSLSPITGPALSQGKELEQKKFDSDFLGDLHDPSRYESIKTVEQTTFDGRPCYKISLVRKGGDEDFEFYDVATGLKAGGTGSRETPMGAITATETRGEYKKFGKLLQPTLLKQSAMGIEQVLTITTLEYDTVAPAAFEPPAAIKALIK